MAVFQEEEINDLPLKASPASTDEIEIQETGGGLSKKATVGSISNINREVANGVAGLDANVEVIRLPAGAAAAAAGTVLQQDGAWVANAGGTANGFTNVKDSGAVGDGVTNDTVAIQAAIDSLNGVGGVVYFPPGIYVVDDSAAGAHPAGDGACLVVDASGYTQWPMLEPFRIDFVGASSGSVVIHNQSANTTTYTLAYVGDPAGTAKAHSFETIEGITFRCDHNPGAGVVYSRGVQVHSKAYLKMQDCNIYKASLGLHLVSTLTSVFENVSIIGNALDGGGITLSTGILLDRAAPIPANPLGADVGFSGCNLNVFTGCKIQHNSSIGISSNTAVNDSVANIRFESCDISGNGTMGTATSGGVYLRTSDIEGGAPFVFENCYFEVNKGGYDISLSNIGATGTAAVKNELTASIRSCTFNRVGATNYVTNCIVAYGNTAYDTLSINVTDCVFQSYTYTASAARPYLNMNAYSIILNTNTKYDKDAGYIKADMYHLDNPATIEIALQTTQPIPTGAAVTDVDMSTVYRDDLGMHTRPGITIPAKVKRVRFSGGVVWDPAGANLGTYKLLQIARTGGLNHGLGQVVDPATITSVSAAKQYVGSVSREVVAGDFYRLAVAQDSPGSINVLNSGATFFSATVEEYGV